MARMEMVSKTEHGRNMPPVSKNMFRLVLKSAESERAKFTEWWVGRKSIPEIAQEFDLTTGQVGWLVNYWELPGRVKPVGISRGAIDVDTLAERLYCTIEPKIKALIDERLDAYTRGKEPMYSA